MGRCHHQQNPTGPPHLAWLVYTRTSERLNSEKTLSVLPFSAQVLSSVTCVRKNAYGGCSSSVYEGSGIRSPFKIPQGMFYLSCLHLRTVSHFSFRSGVRLLFTPKNPLMAHMLNTHKGGNITAATKTPFQNSLFCPLVALLE